MPSPPLLSPDLTVFLILPGPAPATFFPQESLGALAQPTQLSQVCPVDELANTLNSLPNEAVRARGVAAVGPRAPWGQPGWQGSGRYGSWAGDI